MKQFVICVVAKLWLSSNYSILFKFNLFQFVFVFQLSNPLWLEKSVICLFSYNLSILVFRFAYFSVVAQKSNYFIAQILWDWKNRNSFSVCSNFPFLDFLVLFSFRFQLSILPLCSKSDFFSAYFFRFSTFKSNNSIFVKFYDALNPKLWISDWKSAIFGNGLGYGKLRVWSRTFP